MLRAASALTRPLDCSHLLVEIVSHALLPEEGNISGAHVISVSGTNLVALSRDSEKPHFFHLLAIIRSWLCHWALLSG